MTAWLFPTDDRPVGIEDGTMGAAEGNMALFGFGINGMPENMALCVVWCVVCCAM